MVNRHINKGVVLAAGDGSRLQPITNNHPKVLLPIQGKPLICYPIDALVAAGVKQIAVVVGYLATEVRAALGDGRRFGVRLDYILNPDYEGGNAISVSKARAWADGESFILCMGDHIVETEIVSRLLSDSTFADTLCVDYAPPSHHCLAEATKVVVDSAGYIRRIGKELAYWHALDTGVFLLTRRFMSAIDELFPEFSTELEISDVIRFMVSKGEQFATRDVSGCPWTDIDTEEDLKHITG